MDPGSLKTNAAAAAPRKVKFAPKAPPRRVPKAEVKSEIIEETDAAHARDLLRHFNESIAKPKPKFERKVAPSQVAFGLGSSSTTIKSYGVPKNGSNSASAFACGQGKEKDYIEPWDYYSYYPATLPLRRPYSGKPDVLDGEEFEMVSQAAPYDETTINSAIELGLVEESQEPSFFFLQLPPTIPLITRSATMDGQEPAQRSSSTPSIESNRMQKPCSVDDLPGGLIGKMLIYKSGAVKLKLGDTLYDVSSGMDCVFAQDVVAVNTAQKHCCIVGELSKRAVLTPDVDSILSNMSEL